jgi:hypothetical protein
LPKYTDKIKPVKYIVALLYRDETVFKHTLDILSKNFSPPDYISASFPFTNSDYYQAEMGDNLQRKIISLEKLATPGNLVPAKQTTRKIEESLSVKSRRKINLDIGYMDLFKVVLASYKERGNKVYLSDNIWSDFVLYFEKGEYKAFPWSFPDFGSGKYNYDLIRIRDIYKKAVSSIIF